MPASERSKARESGGTPAPRLVDVEPLARSLAAFAHERNWEQFHSPKNLVMALTGEVGELTELFQWMSEDASRLAGTGPEHAQAVRDELADVLLYLVRLADVLGVDLNAAAVHKLQINAARYPVAKAHGSSRKYTEI